MGFLDADYDVGMAESNLKNAKVFLAQVKSGQFDKSNLENAKALVKQREAELARAKERAKKEKASKSSSSKSSSSKSSSSSSAREAAEARAEATARAEAAARQEKLRQQIDEAFEQYRNTFDSNFPYKNASESQLSEWFCLLKTESLRLNKLYDEHQNKEVLGAATKKCLNYVDDAIENIIARVVTPHTEQYKANLVSKYPISGASASALTMGMVYIMQESISFNDEYKANKDNIKGEIALGCKRVAEEYCNKMGDKYAEMELGKYQTELNRKFPIETATAEKIAEYLPQIEAEIKHRKEVCNNNSPEANLDFMRKANSQCKNVAEELGSKACRRLLNLNRRLFNRADILEIAKRIDPEICNPVAQGLLPALDSLENVSKKMAAPFGDMSKMMTNPFEGISKKISSFMSKFFKF